MCIFSRDRSISPGCVGNCRAKPVSRFSVFDATLKKCWQSEM